MLESGGSVWERKALTSPGTAGDTLILAARSDELSLLRFLEQAAGAPFRELPMHAVADDEAPSLASLAAFVQLGEHGSSLMLTTLNR
jgi:hypothetical protein